MVLAGHQIRALFKFRAVPELVTLVVIANLELQLCLRRWPQSKLSSPTLLILGFLLLTLLWEALLITVGALGRLGQENEDLEAHTHTHTLPCCLHLPLYHWYLSSFLFCERRPGASRFLSSSVSLQPSGVLPFLSFSFHLHYCLRVFPHNVLVCTYTPLGLK